MHTETGVLVGDVAGAVAAAHQAPVSIQLLGKDHRQTGLYTLAKFQSVDRHRDLAAGRDLHKCVGLLIRLEWLYCNAIGLLRESQMREGAKRQAADAEDFEKAAPRKCGVTVGLIALKHVLQCAGQLVRKEVG
ncbi:hypothetical protein D3C75_825300 [compost metagenome]